MPTYDQLDNEAAWRAEIEPPALRTLRDGLRRKWPAAGVWIRGDNAHMRGYHRSRRWIKESSFCTDRTYSVSRTSGDRSGGDPNWACALDLGLPQAELHAVCRRLDAAVRAGRLEKITEWYGNFGDDGRVDGFDNISDRIASADSSHLTHLHMSFDRGRANEDHTDLIAILTGDDMSWDQQFANPGAPGTTAAASTYLVYGNHYAYRAMLAGETNKALLEAIATKVGTTPVELAEIKASAEAGAKAGVVAAAEQLAAAIAAELSEELGLTPAQAEAAAERALRKVLGKLDEAPGA